MKLTALCICGTLLMFASPFWTRADSDEGLLLGDKGYGPCVATLRPEVPCREGQHGGTCPYLFSLPPLTVYLPRQLKELEKIVKDLQKLKDSVDELREMCTDCTVSQTERECGRQREGEHVKLNERNWMNERLEENDIRQECGGDRGEMETAEGDSENTLREEKERKKWESERERDKGVVKENEKEETLRKESVTDGKTQTEGSKDKDKLGQRNVSTADGNEGTVNTMTERVADKNNRETDRNKGNAEKGNSKGYQELENGKERKMTTKVKNKEKPGESDRHVWQDETKETETETQTEADDRIKMSEDNGQHTDEEQAQHREERKKEMEEGIKVERNNENLKQTETIGHTEKERTIKEGAVEGERRTTGKEIKTEEEKTESVQRDGDGELASNKAIESTDLVSISPTTHSTIASRPEPMDSNKATIFTSSLPYTPLPSSTLDLITDVSHVTVTNYGPTQSTGLGAAHIPEPPSLNSDSATVSTLGGHGQQTTSATTTVNSRVRPGASFQDHISSTTTTTTTIPRATGHRWTAKKNGSSNAKTGEKPVSGQGLKPGEKQRPGIRREEDQKQKNPRIGRKPDQTPSPDKKTKYNQKQTPSHHKPTTIQPIHIHDPRQDQISEPDQKTPPGTLPVDLNLKNHPRNDRKPDQTPSTDTKTKYDQKQTPSHHKPTTIQSIHTHDPKQDQISEPDQKTPPGTLPVDQNLKNNPRDGRKPNKTISTDAKTKYDQKQTPSQHKPTTIQPITIQDQKQDQISELDQKTPPGTLPVDQNLKNNPRDGRKPDQTPSPATKTKYDQKQTPSHQKPITIQPIPIQDPEQDQKTPVGTLPVDLNLKNNPRNDRKPDQSPSTDTKTKYDQKQTPSHHKPTTIQPIHTHDPKQDQISEPDQKTPPGTLPVDLNLKNNPRDGRKPDQPISTDTKTKYDQKQTPSHHTPTTTQSMHIHNPKKDQIPEPDQTTPPGNLPVDQNLKNNPRDDHKPDQTPSPDTKTKYNQKQKPSHHKPTATQPHDPKQDQISEPDPTIPLGTLPTGQNPKNPKNYEDSAPDQNKLPSQNPKSHQKPVTPARRPASHQRPPTVKHSDKYPPTDQGGQESDEIPGVNPTSEPENKWVHYSKNDKAVQKQTPENERKSEENKTAGERFEPNRSPKPFQEPESERSETATSAPKLNEKPQNEPKSDENPSTETKSNQDLKPGKKITLNGANVTSDQRPQPSQKIPGQRIPGQRIPGQRITGQRIPGQKPKPGQMPKPKQKHSKPVTDLKTKPNVKPKNDQGPQTNQSVITLRPGQIPHLSPNSVPDEVPKAEFNKTSKPRPPSRFRPPTRPAVKPGAVPVQRPKSAVQPKPNPKAKTHSDPPQISWTTSDDIQNSLTNMTPTSGPIKPAPEVAHSPEDTEVSPSTRKTITLSPKTSNSLETGPFTNHHSLPEDVTMSPNSRTMSDLRPQTATKPPSIPSTMRPNKIVHGIPPTVTPSTSPESANPNQMSESDSSSQTKTLHKVEETTTSQTTTVVPSPSPETTSTLRPDSRSTTSATSGPQPLAVEASTPSARELRVKINQVAAFLNNSLNPNGRPPNRYTKEHPKDTQGGSQPDGTEPPTPLPSKVPRDCSDHLLRGETKSGVYLVTPDLRSRSFPVFCDMESDGGGWTLLQRRQDGSVSFNRTWAEYQSGFGELDGGEFWLGNHMIHLLTRDRDMGLRVDLEDFDGKREHAQYELFRVASERLRFRLTVGGYSGTAGDALRFNKRYDHNNRAFTTPDKDNDRYPSGNCGAYYSSGWWFDACMAANLNGRYYVGKYKGVRDGIFWGTWHNISSEYYPTNERHSFKSVRMMIRPKGFAP
ncbi:mucin-2-like [Mugil cephalus]|uniref:mucin-2-like n=1 Tax=Mugil cephalus TaxID=48193 RepID=UPI001FB5821F|nr:mucin-2-like [Mugil cephalus]